MRIFLAIPALAAMLCAVPVAEANLVNATSTFHDHNLNYTGSPSPFPTAHNSGLTTFSVISSPGNNTVLPGDSVNFTLSPVGGTFFGTPVNDRYIRGTNDPGDVPHVVSINKGLAGTHTISFNVAEPITEIVLSVLSLRDSRTLAFSGATADNISGVTGDLTHVLGSGTVGSSLSGAPGNSAAGDIVWTFDTPVTNPEIVLTFNSALNTQVHFAGISYTTVAAVPEPLSFVWFASAFGLVQYGRRRRMDADLAD